MEVLFYPLDLLVVVLSIGSEILSFTITDDPRLEAAEAGHMLSLAFAGLTSCIRGVLVPCGTVQEMLEPSTLTTGFKPFWQAVPAFESLLTLVHS